MNKIILTGRLVKDPDLRYTQSGTAVASFTLAVNRNYKTKAGTYDADFINCQAWRQTAEFVSQYFKKGQMMALDGRLQVRTYEKDGQRHWITEVIAGNVEFCGRKDEQGTKSQQTAQQQTTPSQSDSLFSDEEIDFNEEDLPF